MPGATFDDIAVTLAAERSRLERQLDALADVERAIACYRSRCAGDAATVPDARTAPPGEPACTPPAAT
jgi:hypothetical protein